MLVDTSVLIDHLRGRVDATQFLNATRARSGLITSVVVAAELLTGARDRIELREIDRLLARFQIEPLIPTDCSEALDFLRNHHLSNNIGWPDCLIAATAKRLVMPVATLNARHFRVIPSLTVVRPY